MSTPEPAQQNPPEHESGNTKFRSRGWVFTLNNPEIDDAPHIIGYCERYKATYVFQEETGTSGTEHLQGFIHFPNALQFSTLKKMIPRAHIEVAKDWKRSAKYCSKTETRTGRVYTNMPEVKVASDELNIKLRDWQLELNYYLSHHKPDPRKVLWIYDRKGGTGKTTFAKWFISSSNSKCLYLNSGKTGDLMFACAKYRPTTVFINVSRTQMERFNYQALEQVKDGIFFSGKYESDMVVMQIPHVIVFANAPPETKSLSEDRWLIMEM